MASMLDWKKEIDKMDEPQLEKIQKAIEVLRDWKFFEQNFKSQGIFLIGAIINSDLRWRKEG
jgi:hypothetical protein